MGNTTRVALTDQWQQIDGSGGEIFMQGIFEFCVCATEPAADNPCHPMSGEQLKLPEGMSVYVRRNGGLPGQSYMTYTLFE